MSFCPIDKGLIDSLIKKAHLTDFSKATIREINGVAASIEKESGVEFVKMEIGVPGLPPSAVGIQAETAALQRGVASIYPPIQGIPALKNAASQFVKAFVNVEVSPEACVPVCGTMQGTFACFLEASQCLPGKNKVLFIDPGFPVQKQQLRVLGIEYKTFDIYQYRGEKLRGALEEYLKDGDVCAMIYSNPNNPSWVCLREEELKIIGEMSNKYDVLVLEDLAYFAMDFRRELGTPFEPPYQLSVANYTDNFILLISGSKAFSYAGQRIGVCCISPKVFAREYEGLTKRYGGGTFGSVLIQRILYALSSGTSHSAQYALAAIMEAANNGSYHFLEEVKEYGRRAKRLKEIFLKNGFVLTYDKDIDQPIADGFYFTLSYGNMSGGELARELLAYGVSAIPLTNTGSRREGIRACTSFIKPNQYELLEERMPEFRRNHPVRD